jgi:hypothetical protein
MVKEEKKILHREQFGHIQMSFDQHKLCLPSLAHCFRNGHVKAIVFLHLFLFGRQIDGNVGEGPILIGIARRGCVWPNEQWSYICLPV